MKILEMNALVFLLTVTLWLIYMIWRWDDEN